MRNRMHIRQGDILFIRIGDSAPAQTEANRRIVVARGEATGHAHVVAGVDVVRSGDRLSIPHGAAVQHEEHAELYLPPGEWEIRQQQEWQQVTPHAGLFRRVLD